MSETQIDRSGLKPGWERELREVYEEVFRRSKQGKEEQQPGLIERLENVERLLRYGVLASGVAGAFIGSLLTLIVQTVLAHALH